MYVPNFSLSAKSNYSLWNYPCARPCFDLCWKSVLVRVFLSLKKCRWLTTNANSLHAVSLQLKILWFTIKWSEFFPGDDETEDGRLIVHQPDRDEIRHVTAHKEFPPQGTYERYFLQVEVIVAFFFSIGVNRCLQHSTGRNTLWLRTMLRVSCWMTTKRTMTMSIVAAVPGRKKRRPLCARSEQLLGKQGKLPVRNGLMELNLKYLK